MMKFTGTGLVIFLATLGVVAQASLLKKVRRDQEKATLDQAPGAGLNPTFKNRHWYMCIGPQFSAATPDEVALDIRSANDVCCTREMTFGELCCMDFTKLIAYTNPASAAPYNAATCGSLDLDAAQLTPGAPGAMEDDMSAWANSKVAFVCTTQVASLDIAEAEGGGAVTLGGQTCLTEEFNIDDIVASEGAVVLDARIAFLEKQGLPGSSIPVCHAQVQTCPATSARAQQPPNSASDATLQRIGLPRSLAAQERAEDEEAAIPANTAFAGARRERRSYMKTLRMIAAMNEADLRDTLGSDMRLTVVTKDSRALRMKVEKWELGDRFMISGKGVNGATTIEVGKDTAELIIDGKHEALDLDAMVLTSLGRSGSLYGRRAGGADFGGGSLIVSSGSNAAGNDFL